MSGVTVYALCTLCSRPVRYQRNVDRWVDLSGIKPALCERSNETDEDDQIHWPDRSTVLWQVGPAASA